MSEVLKPLERGLKRFLSRCLRFLLPSRPVRPPDPKSVRNILVIRQHNQMGDMLCVVPLLRALRSFYSRARVSLLTSSVNNRVMLNNLYLDEVIVFDKKQFLGQGGIHPVRFAEYVRALRSRRFDMAIVPATVSMSATSDLLGFASRAPVRVGAESLGPADNPYGFLFNVSRRLAWDSEPHRHQTLRNYDVVAHFVPEPSDLTHELTLTPEEVNRGRERAAAIRNGFERVIAFHPGAGKVPNRWPALRFAELANTLGEELRAMVLVVSGPMDEAPVRAMENGLRRRYYLLKNEEIRAVAAILKFTALLVSNDTGIMHVGAGVGTPVLSIFGPTDPRQWAPLGGKHRYIAGEGGDIETVPLEDVLQAAREMLRG